MTFYYKKNPITGEHDVPYSWVESLKEVAKNTWLPKWKRDKVSQIADTLTEEEAEKMARELRGDVDREIEYWRIYQ